MRNESQRAFSLVELAVVLGVIGAVIGGIWYAASNTRQHMREQESFTDIAVLADATRSSYVAAAAITGGIATVVPALVAAKGVPSTLLRPAGETCSNTGSLCLDTPWSGTAGSYPYGTLGLCAWNGVTRCPTGGAATAQYFAIEFMGLDYQSCLDLAEGISPTSPVGLTDIYINGTSSAASGALPPIPALAGANCAAGSFTNAVDFVYRLRPS